jgi:hypothetical protein
VAGDAVRAPVEEGLSSLADFLVIAAVTVAAALVILVLAVRKGGKGKGRRR